MDRCSNRMHGHPCSGRVGVPTRSPTAPGRRSYRRGSVARIKNLCSDLEEISVPRAEYESDKFARSVAESVKSRLSWWRKRAREHNVEAYPITVERLQLLWAFLKSWTQVCSLSVVKNQHIRLVHPWTDALDLEMREGKRACDRGIGPPQKVWSFRFAEISKLVDFRQPVMRRWTHVATGRNFVWCWWAMREIEFVGCQVYAGRVLGWSRLRTVCFRVGKVEDTHVCLFTRSCGK